MMRIHPRGTWAVELVMGRLGGRGNIRKFGFWIGKLMRI